MFDSSKKKKGFISFHLKEKNHPYPIVVEYIMRKRNVSEDEALASIFERGMVAMFREIMEESIELSISSMEKFLKDFSDIAEAVGGTDGEEKQQATPEAERGH